MESAVKILYIPEEQARQEIWNFVNEGLKDVQDKYKVKKSINRRGEK